MDQEKRDKIISCYDNLKSNSVARIFNISIAVVHTVWRKAGRYRKDLIE